MNSSDTKFSVVSTNVIIKDKIGDQSSPVSITESLIHILSTQNKDEINTLDQDKPNSPSTT